MAKRTFVELIDDLDGTKADETVTFAVDGVQYEIDLSAKNAGKLRNDLAKWVAQGRKVSGRRPAKNRFTQPTDSGAIRDWAAANGYKVSARGRISADVRKAYEATH